MAAGDRGPRRSPRPSLPHAVLLQTSTPRPGPATGRRGQRSAPQPAGLRCLCQGRRAQVPQRAPVDGLGGARPDSQLLAHPDGRARHFPDTGPDGRPPRLRADARRCLCPAQERQPSQPRARGQHMVGGQHRHPAVDREPPAAQRPPAADGHLCPQPVLRQGAELLAAVLAVGPGPVLRSTRARNLDRPLSAPWHADLRLRVHDPHRPRSGVSVLRRPPGRGPVGHQSAAAFAPLEADLRLWLGSRLRRSAPQQRRPAHRAGPTEAGLLRVRAARPHRPAGPPTASARSGPAEISQDRSRAGTPGTVRCSSWPQRSRRAGDDGPR